MCHGQAGLLLLSFSFILSLFPHSLRFLLFIGWCRSRTTNQFQSLSQWGLTGQFVSLRGNRIHSSVPQKTLFFQTEGAFCLVTIAIELLQFMWLIQIEVLRCISGGGGWGGVDMMACCAHYRQAMSSCVAMFVTNNQIVTSSALKQSFQMIPNYLCDS